MFPRDIPSRSLPVADHLRDCIDLAEKGRALVTLLASARASLSWGQTYSAADFGTEFLRGYGWVELFGTRGHFVNDHVAGGFLMLGPDIVYPDHHHVAEEIYVPLAGTAEWRMGGGDFAPKLPDAVIHHPSNVSHAMRTAGEPLIALYLWRGGPLDQKSTIGATN